MVLRFQVGLAGCLNPYSHPPSTQIPPGCSGPHGVFQYYLWSLEERSELDAALLSAQKLLWLNFMAAPGLGGAWAWQRPGQVEPATYWWQLLSKTLLKQETVRVYCRRSIANKRFWNAKELFQTMDIKKNNNHAKRKTGLSSYSLLLTTILQYCFCIERLKEYAIKIVGEKDY